MDYEKKYKEALERIKDNEPDENGIIHIRPFEIFPELAESEDDRIMKAILIYLDWLDGRIGYEPKGEYSLSDMIAWLKKQGEPTEINPSEFDLRLNRLLKQFEALPKEELASSLSFYLNVVQNDGTYREEKQGEQKPVYMVEPKFHIGDWLQYRNAKPFFVEEITKQGYVNGDSCLPFNWENEIHLWTIEDAKDGDVLFTSSTASHETFIFKSIDERGNAECYFAYDSEDGFREGKYHFIGSAINCKPATKEQRNLLFQKMHEAGYEWDSSAAINDGGLLYSERQDLQDRIRKLVEYIDRRISK